MIWKKFKQIRIPENRLFKWYKNVWWVLLVGVVGVVGIVGVVGVVDVVGVHGNCAFLTLLGLKALNNVK